MTDKFVSQAITKDPMIPQFFMLLLILHRQASKEGRGYKKMTSGSGPSQDTKVNRDVAGPSSQDLGLLSVEMC